MSVNNIMSHRPSQSANHIQLFPSKHKVEWLIKFQAIKKPTNFHFENSLAI